jgi:hypothetical protein
MWDILDTALLIPDYAAAAGFESEDLVVSTAAVRLEQTLDDETMERSSSL